MTDSLLKGLVRLQAGSFDKLAQKDLFFSLIVLYFFDHDMSHVVHYIYKYILNLHLAYIPENVRACVSLYIVILSI